MSIAPYEASHKGWFTGLVTGKATCERVALPEFLKGVDVTIEETVSDPLILMALGLPPCRRTWPRSAVDMHSESRPWVESLVPSLGSTSDPVATHPRDLILGTKLKDFVWSKQASQIFDELGLKTVAQLVSSTQEDLLRASLCGRESLNMIRTFLGSHGLCLGMKQKSD